MLCSLGRRRDRVSPFQCRFLENGSNDFYSLERPGWGDAGSASPRLPSSSTFGCPVGRSSISPAGAALGMFAVPGGAARALPALRWRWRPRSGAPGRVWVCALPACGARRGQQRERTRRGAVAAPLPAGAAGARGEGKDFPNRPVSPIARPGRSPRQCDSSIVLPCKAIWAVPAAGLDPRTKGCEFGHCPPEHLFSNHSTKSTNTFLSRHHIWECHPQYAIGALNVTVTSPALVSISDYKCWSFHALLGYAAQSSVPDSRGPRCRIGWNKSFA